MGYNHQAPIFLICTNQSYMTALAAQVMSEETRTGNLFYEQIQAEIEAHSLPIEGLLKTGVDLAREMIRERASLLGIPVPSEMPLAFLENEDYNRIVGKLHSRPEKTDGYSHRLVASVICRNRPNIPTFLEASIAAHEFAHKYLIPNPADSLQVGNATGSVSIHPAETTRTTGRRVVGTSINSLTDLGCYAFQGEFISAALERKDFSEEIAAQEEFRTQNGIGPEDSQMATIGNRRCFFYRHNILFDNEGTPLVDTIPIIEIQVADTLSRLCCEIFGLSLTDALLSAERRPDVREVLQQWLDRIFEVGD